MDSCGLYPGSSFSGSQKNDSGVGNQVEVLVQTIDWDEGTLTGYLTVHGLTSNAPDPLTTLFEGEIIGPNHMFLTRKWGANAPTDMSYWGRFDGFPGVSLSKDHASLDVRTDENVFMRWKEVCFVPDHNAVIDGVSYAGFYYVCYNRLKKEMCGYYYHHTDVYQALELKQDESRSFGSFALR